MLDTLGSVICHPQYKHWEVADTKASLLLDVARAQATPTSVILEAVHQVAYRSARNTLPLPGPIAVP